MLTAIITRNIYEAAPNSRAISIILNDLSTENLNSSEEWHTDSSPIKAQGIITEIENTCNAGFPPGTK